jgi:hypothetical protein
LEAQKVKIEDYLKSNTDCELAKKTKLLKELQQQQQENQKKDDKL